MQFTPLGNLLFIGFTLFYVGNVICPDPEPAKDEGLRLVPDPSEPTNEFIDLLIDNTSNLSYESFNGVHPDYSKYSYDVDNYNKGILKYPNTLKNLFFHVFVLDFDTHAKLQSFDVHQVDLFTTKDNKPICVRFNGATECTLFALDDNTEKWTNFNPATLSTHRKTDANGVVSYKFSEDDPNDPFNKALDVELARLAGVDPNTERKVKRGDPVSKEPLKVKYRSFGTATASRQHPGREEFDIPFLPTELFRQYTPEANNILLKIHFFVIVKNLKHMFSHISDELTDALVEGDRKKSNQSYVDDKKKKLEELNKKLQDKLTAYENAKEVKDWLASLPGFADLLKQIKELIDELYEKTHKAYKDDESKAEKKEEKAEGETEPKSKQLARGYRRLKVDALLSLVDALDILVDNFGEEDTTKDFDLKLDEKKKGPEAAKEKKKEEKEEEEKHDDRKDIEKHSKEFEKHSKNAHLLVGQFLNEKDEQEQDKKVKEVADEALSGNREFKGVLDAVFEARKRKDVEVAEGYASKVETFVKELIHVSRSMIPGILSVILSAALLLLV